MKEFTKEDLKTEGKILVKVGAPWCGPCRQVQPILETMVDDGIEIYEINADEESDLVEEYGIKSLPTFLVFENGKVIKSEVGFKNRSQLEEMLK